MDKLLPSPAAIDSTRELWLLLQEAEQNESAEFESLKKNCQTQVTLSKFSLPSRKIKPLALNTLKAAADTVIENGGWAKLDSKRKEIYHSTFLKGERRRTKDSILKSSQDRLKSEKEKNRVMLLERVVTVAAYRDLVAAVLEYSNTNPGLMERLKRHEATFDIKIISNLSGGETNETQ